MAKDDRDILELLKFELDFIENGGYGRSVRTPWKRTSIFQDSLTCINFGDPARTRPCHECLLMEFVPSDDRSTDVPCHHIPVGPKGETIETISQKDDEEALEDAVEGWLRATIARIEHSRVQLAAARARGYAKVNAAGGHRKSVLIVDDDERVLMDIEERLEGEGYSTTTAWSGQEALRLLRLGAFDLVLLDDYLSDVSTEEVLRQMGTMPDAPPAMVLWATPPSQSNAARSSHLGAAGHVPKRDLEQLVRSVEQQFAASAASPQRP